jgi:outer membrane receptor for Fe3+-dicitrate
MIETNMEDKRIKDRKVCHEIKLQFPKLLDDIGHQKHGFTLVYSPKHKHHFYELYESDFSPEVDLVKNKLYLSGHARLINGIVTSKSLNIELGERFEDLDILVSNDSSYEERISYNNDLYYKELQDGHWVPDWNFHHTDTLENVWKSYKESLKSWLGIDIDKDYPIQKNT